MSNTSVVFPFLVDAQKYILYINYISLAVGLIGNSLNFLVFTNLTLFRGNRCAFYLIVESILNIIVLFFFGIPQMFQQIYGAEIADTFEIWCKLKTTAGQPFRLLAHYIISFEALDQYMSTNHNFHIRQFNTLKFARLLIISSIFLFILQTIPYNFYYSVVPSYGCIITNIHLIHYYSYFYYIFLNGLIPILASCLFGLLAYRNVRHIIKRQIPIERRRLDRQMTAMIFVRVICFVIFLSPYTIYRIYVLNINVSASNVLHKMINQLISVIVGVLLLWNYSLNFYIFLITSSRFRHQVKYFLVKKCWQSMKQWFHFSHNEIHPHNRASVMSPVELE